MLLFQHSSGVDCVIERSESQPCSARSASGVALPLRPVILSSRSCSCRTVHYQKRSREVFPQKFLSSRLNPLCLAVCLVAGIFVGASAQTVEETAVRGVVSKFFEAYQHRDLKEAMSLWSEKSPELVRARENLRESFRLSPKLEVKSVSFGGSSSQADQVKISVVVEVTNLVAPTEQPVEGVARMNRSFWLVKDGLNWKIWKYASTEAELAEA